MGKHIVYLIGDGGVGKTTYMYRATTGLVWNVNQTIGMEAQTIKFSSLLLKDFKISSSSDHFVLRDYGGQRQFFDLLKIEKTSPDLCFLCFSLSDFKTFLRLEEFIDIIEKGTPIAVLGMKSELKWEVTSEEISEFCKETNGHFFPISSFSFQNIYSPFNNYLQKIYNIDNDNLIRSLVPTQSIALGLYDIILNNSQFRELYKNTEFKSNLATNIREKVRKIFNDLCIDYDPRYEKLITSVINNYRSII